MKTVADVMLEALAYWGVQNIYGMVGDAILPLMKAMEKQDRIHFYSVAHEQGAAFMANGEARVTGRPGVCLATEGPGALNLLNGVADACRDGIPMLVLTGQVELMKLAQNTKQYFDQQQVFAPLTGSTTLLTRPESVLETLKTALEKARGDSIPCHISLPKDILASPAQAVSPSPLGQPSLPGINGRVDLAVSLMRKKSRPIMIAGRAALPYKDLALRLSRACGAGIIPGQGARAIIAGSDEYFVGGMGEAHIPPVLQRADCLLLLGACPYEHQFLPPGLPVIELELNQQNAAAGLATNHTTLLLTGDMAAILHGLIGGLDGYTPDAAWVEEIKRAHRAFLEMLQGERDLPGIPIPPQRIIAALNEVLPSQAIVVLDTGEFMHWFDRGFIPKEQRVLISDYWRCMGSALPIGLGILAAGRSKQSGQKVVVLAGDGGFALSMQEMLTALRYQLPVTVVLFKNRGYLLEEHKMAKSGAKTSGTHLPDADFAGWTSQCGGLGLKVERPEDLAPMVQKAIEAEVPALVEIETQTVKPLFI